MRECVSSTCTALRPSTRALGPKECVLRRSCAAVSLAHSRVLRLGVCCSIIVCVCVCVYVRASLSLSFSLIRATRSFARLLVRSSVRRSFDSRAVSLSPSPPPSLRLSRLSALRACFSRASSPHAPGLSLFLDHRAIDVTSRRAVKPCSLSCYLDIYSWLRGAPTWAPRQ